MIQSGELRRREQLVIGTSFPFLWTKKKERCGGRNRVKRDNGNSELLERILFLAHLQDVLSAGKLDRLSDKETIFSS